MTIDLPIPRTAEERYPSPAASQAAPEMPESVAYQIRAQCGWGPELLTEKEKALLWLADRVAELERLNGLLDEDLATANANHADALQRLSALQASSAQETKMTMPASQPVDGMPEYVRHWIDNASYWRASGLEPQDTWGESILWLAKSFGTAQQRAVEMEKDRDVWKRRCELV